MAIIGDNHHLENDHLLNWQAFGCSLGLGLGLDNIQDKVLSSSDCTTWLVYSLMSMVSDEPTL